MKTILVPTDFSEVARNAVGYAAEIGKRAKAKIILLHVYQIPVVPAEVPVILSADEIKKDSMKRLKKIERHIHTKYSKTLKVECKCECGFPIDEINQFASKNNVNLIVMGMAGVGYLTERIIGSVTTSLIKRSKCPVLSIDRYVKFKNIKKIVLACDYNKSYNKKTITPLKELAALFKSHIHVLNIVKEPEFVPPVNKAIAGIKLDRTLEEINHSFYQCKNEDIIEGINDFIDKKKIDMVVMISRKHSVLHNLFHETNTKRMAFHTKVPVLALHE